MLRDLFEVLHTETLRDGQHIMKTIELKLMKEEREKVLKYLAEKAKLFYCLDIPEQVVQSEELDVVDIDGVLNFIKEHIIPKESAKKPKQLSDARNEMAEILGMIFLQEQLTVEYPYPKLAQKEGSKGPSLGIDSFGILYNVEEDIFKVVINETKCSSSKKNPPDVVGLSKSNLYDTLTRAKNIDNRFKHEICKIARIATNDRYTKIAIKIIDHIVNQKEFDIQKNLLVVPFMVRQKQFWSKDDYGKFIDDKYTDFHNVELKFLICAIDEDLNQFAKDMYAAIGFDLVLDEKGEEENEI